jgi:hypothetical protein
MIINLAFKDFMKLSECFVAPPRASRLGGIAMTTKDFFRILLKGNAFFRADTSAE